MRNLWGFEGFWFYFFVSSVLKLCSGSSVLLSSRPGIHRERICFPKYSTFSRCNSRLGCKPYFPWCVLLSGTQV